MQAQGLGLGGAKELCRRKLPLQNVARATFGAAHTAQQAGNMHMRA